jgi:LuxR family maltose regulon positive regulatory protein
VKPPKVRRPDLIRTKFSKPPNRPEFVERHRLLDQLGKVVEHRVTLVSAPPGFGKTTLATQWLARLRIPGAWLSLDKSDSDPERFVRYLVAAIEESTPKRLSESAALLAARMHPPFEHLCEVLVSELAAGKTPLILVLEDYDTVESNQVHGLVERLVQNMPPSLHLLVVSRVDPPWPLEHWRARGWLAEVRARDLRFTLEEAGRFFAAERGAGLSSDIIEKLHARAEGWIVALRLVQLSLRDASRPEEQARVLSGTDRLVASYLVSEVLAAQPPEIQRFLTVTAPLARFSAPLCDHLLAGRAAEPPARETLARIIHLNLFIVALDSEGEWYRYHHLFQSLLLHHLPELGRPERRAEIDRAAAKWFAREGFVEEALRHLINAGAIDAAADLLGESIRPVLDADMTRQVLQRWLSPFPAGAERGRLPLLVAHTYLRMAKWDLRGMGELIDEAMRLLRTPAPRGSAPATVRFQADVDALAAFKHYWSGNPTAALEAGTRALSALPPRRGGMARWLATCYKAGGLVAAGRSGDALALLERAIEDASATGERGMDVLLLTEAVVHWYATELSSVALSARRMLAIHDATPIEPYHLGHAHHMLGLVAYAENRLAEAAAEFDQVVAMRYQVNTRAYQDGLMGLCLVARATGDAARVASYAAKVRATALQAGDPVSLRLADWFDVRLTLDAGGGRRPVFTPPAADDSMSFWLEVPSVTYAEALLRHPSTASRESALSVIERSLERVDGRHNMSQSIVFSLLRAQALADRGEDQAALDALAVTVRRGEPTGLVRPFLDRGPQLRRLLEALAAREGRTGYLGSLLAASQGGPTARALDEAATLASAMSLSNRELDVLELLAQRLSNKEIAERLKVSSETIKKHTRNLYLKLDVHGRREAVAKGVIEHLIKVRT